jgi:hypothetical protein
MGVQINGDTGNISATKADYSGNVTIGGTLTYEDVTNIDSVGLVTAREGIEVGARPGVAASISVDGNMIVSGVTTIGGNIKVGTGVTLSPDGDIFTTGVSTFSGEVSVNDTINVTGHVTIADKVRHTGDLDTAIRFPSSDTVSFETSGTESFRLDSSQRFLKGITTSRGNFANNTSGVDYKFQIEGTGALESTLALVRNSNDAADGGIVIGKTRSASVGGNTVLQAGDDLGSITWAGADGTTLQFGAQITAEVASGVGNDDMPSDLLFFTNAGSTSLTERMRINSSGKLLIGRTSASSYDNQLQLKSITVETDGDTTGMAFNRTDSNSAWVAMRFYAQGSQSGYIQVNTSSTTYSTSSDYRLKENAVSISDGITRLKQLKPYRFNWKSNPSGDKVDGFFAHEVSDIVPQAVSGEKDAVDKDGNPDHQVIDHSKLVPLLTAALQEAVTEIESLKARLDAAGL